MDKPEQDRLDGIKHLLELADDRVGPDSSLRWLIGEVDRLRANQVVLDGELRVLQALLEKINNRLGAQVWVPSHSAQDTDYIVSKTIHHLNGNRRELAEIHDLAAEALGYQRAPSLEEDPNCPCPGQFITGEHTAQTLVMELVKKYQELQTKSYG